MVPSAAGTARLTVCALGTIRAARFAALAPFGALREKKLSYVVVLLTPAKRPHRCARSLPCPHRSETLGTERRSMSGGRHGSNGRRLTALAVRDPLLRGVHSVDGGID